MRKLQDRRWRDKLGLFAVEGEDLVEAGLAVGLEPQELFVAGDNVSAEALGSVSSLAARASAVAVFRRDDLPSSTRRSAARGVALWRVGDPGNLGTIMRAADGLGPAFVALSSGCADPTGPKALRGLDGCRVPRSGRQVRGGSAAARRARRARRRAAARG